MIHFKVRSGMIDSGAENLCITCHSATRIKPDLGEERTFCNTIEQWLTVPKVVECSSYSDKRLPGLSTMQKMAWVLRTDGAKKSIGFVPSKEYYRDNKDEDVYDPAYMDPMIRKLR